AGQRAERRGFGATGVAPGAPEVEHDRLPPVRVQAQRLAGDRRPGDGRHRRPLADLVERRLVAVADEALAAALRHVRRDLAAVARPTRAATAAPIAMRAVTGSRDTRMISYRQ